LESPRQQHIDKLFVLRRAIVYILENLPHRAAERLCTAQVFAPAATTGIVSHPPLSAVI